MFWLKKFKRLSKKNLKDWKKVINSAMNSSQQNAIISYLQWNLKKEIMDLPFCSSPAIQDDYRKKIWESCNKWVLSDEYMEIVKVLVPLTNNPNVPNNNGDTPINAAAFHGQAEIVKTYRI